MSVVSLQLAVVIAASLAVAAVSTLGDAVWAHWIPQHRPIYGLLHGSLLFASIGFVLGVIRGAPGSTTLLGMAIGLVAAGSFYVLVPIAGYSVMFLVWSGVWIALAFLSGPARSSHQALVLRGLIAGVGSGLAFYAISGIWQPFNPQGADYVVHFLAWTVAYLPGFAALILGRVTPHA